MTRASRHRKGEIRIGTASWSDPGFVAAWYPKGLPATERLPWYAEHFNLVEVNSSFYAIPKREVVERWCQQTPPGFLFDVKLHRLLSRHSTSPKLLPPDLRQGVNVHKDRIVLTPEVERVIAKRFLREIEPLRAHSKLGALLLQLSPSFRPKTQTLQELDHIFDCLTGYTVAVELRNRDWFTGPQLAVTLEFFRKRQISLVSVDSPPAEHFMIAPSGDYLTDKKLSYLRCHGRNSEGYIRGRTVAQRFDYKYRKEELQEITERAVKLAEQTETVHVVYNNNAVNYAPVNAGEMYEIVEEKFPEVSTGPKPALVSLDKPDRKPQLELQEVVG